MNELVISNWQISEILLIDKFQSNHIELRGLTKKLALLIFFSLFKYTWMEIDKREKIERS